MLNREANIGSQVSLYQTTLGSYTEIQDHCELHEVVMGDYSYCAGNNQIHYATIGKFCSIASGVRINPGNHPTYTRVAQHHFTYRSEQFGFGGDDEAFFQWRRDQKVTIGHDVWIGHNAIIMPGVTVGNGAVIGSGAVVTKDVQAYSIVAGVPAKRLNMRFSPELIEKIEQSAWWDWPYETIKQHLADFRDLERFQENCL